MGIFDVLGYKDINKGVEEYRALSDALLLDVRTPEEYSRGHIPGSINIPLSSLDEVAFVAEDKNRPLFVHCLSGARSGRAVAELKEMGYANVKNIGGINHYRGGLAV